MLQWAIGYSRDYVPKELCSSNLYYPLRAFPLHPNKNVNLNLNFGGHYVFFNKKACWQGRWILCSLMSK